MKVVERPYCKRPQVLEHKNFQDSCFNLNASPCTIDGQSPIEYLFYVVHRATAFASPGSLLEADNFSFSALKQE